MFTNVSIITTALCNLNCSFCYLHKNKAYKEYDKIIQEALLDGSYIENMKQTIKKINEDPKQVVQLELWGGETLLKIENFIPNVKEVCALFPNIQTLRISTNWMINIDNFILFLNELEKYANKEITVKLQLSIDGPPGEISEHGHNGNWDTYRQNIDKITEYFNNHLFEKIKIMFVINSTVGRDDYFKYFTTYEGMTNYIKYMEDFCTYIKKRCISKALEFDFMTIFPGFATAYGETTTEDGIKLRDIMRLWEYVRTNEFPEIPEYCHFYEGIGDITSNNGLFLPNPECSELKNAFTFLPDGSIASCSGTFIDHYDKYQEELKNEKNNKLLAASKIEETLTLNILNMTDEEIEKAKWYVSTGTKQTHSIQAQYVFSLCIEMALSGQIPRKYYYDQELLLKHVYMFLGLHACVRDNIQTTLSPFLLDPNEIRQFFNGLNDYGYETELLFLKRREF